MHFETNIYLVTVGQKLCSSSSSGAERDTCEIKASTEYYYDFHIYDTKRGTLQRQPLHHFI